MRSARILGVILSLHVMTASAYVEQDVNTFNNTSKCNGCDLSGMYIGGNHPGASLINTILDNSTLVANLTRCDLSNASMNHVTADGVFSHCNVRNAQMTQSRFFNADFSNAGLTGAILSHSYFDGANFLGAKISNQQLSTASSTCDAILPDGSIAACHIKS